MEETLLRHPRLTVHKRTGSEGPKHDPYGFVEITATTPRGEIMIHAGLAEYLKVNGVLFDNPRREWMEEQWESFTGFTLTQIGRIRRKLKSRCKCGSKDFSCESGFPGEHLLVCMSCGNIHDSYFNLSEVE